MPLTPKGGTEISIDYCNKDIILNEKYKSKYTKRN